MILHLGVTDMPYAQAPKKHRRKSGLAPNETTGDVAQILEDKYHVMESFFHANEELIAKELEGSISGALESLLMSKGGSLTKQMLAGTVTGLGTGEGKIKEAFTNFISGQGVERLGIPGVPTKAAIKGVNHRLKRPYASSNPRRPSFIDTGLYESSFQAWFD